MSFQAMKWAIKQKVGTAMGRAILFTLADYADEKGQCYPSQATLSNDCECSLRSVTHWLKKFEEIGIIVRNERRRKDGYRTSDAIQIQLHKTSYSSFSQENDSCENNSNLTRNQYVARTFQNNLSESFSDTHVSSKDARTREREFEDNSLSSACSEQKPQERNHDQPKQCQPFTARSRAPVRHRQAKKIEVEHEFHETFWAEYPHKVGKPKALNAFLKARSRESLKNIMNGLHRYIESKPTDRSWLNPVTFLNQERWNDQPAPIQKGQYKQSNFTDAFTEALFEIDTELAAKKARNESANMSDWLWNHIRNP